MKKIILFSLLLLSNIVAFSQATILHSYRVGIISNQTKVYDIENTIYINGNNVTIKNTEQTLSYITAVQVPIEKYRNDYGYAFQFYGRDILHENQIVKIVLFWWDNGNKTITFTYESAVFIYYYIE